MQQQCADSVASQHGKQGEPPGARDPRARFKAKDVMMQDGRRALHVGLDPSVLQCSASEEARHASARPPHRSVIVPSS